jgi:F-type H+-transporting ATPase subunit a
MTIIELVSLLIRPITLAIRLATNIIAGHLLLTLLSNQFYTNYSYSLKTSLLSPHLVLLLLESGVAIVQAYVFATLCVLYSGEVN